MATDQIRFGEAAGLAYREATPTGEERGAPVLCIHGFPESSHMWNEILPVVAAGGRRAIAPDLPGFGDSPADPPTTWERLAEAVESFVEALGLERLVLVVHDWGGLIGLRWACDNPDRVVGLVISDTGFFPDAKWHDMAATFRTEGAGEDLIGAIDREGLGATLKTLSSGITDEAIDNYWKPLATAEGKRAVLEMYRSGDFEKLVPYEGQLGALGVPALMIWGENDPFAPVAGAHRFAAEIPDSRIHVVEGGGHFVFSDAPEECAAQIAAFLGELDDASA